MTFRFNINESICGWLNINKEYNITSARVVSEVKKILGAKKVGHAGTLDPLATGVLPIALGAATKTVRFMMNAEKTYEFEINWGNQTDTDDREGKTIAESTVRPSKQEIENDLIKFIGNIYQRPPSFSAKKVNGIRSYKLARESQPIKLSKRSVKIKKLELLKYINSDYSRFFLKCEKGVYVRSLARDLALKLGTYGHVSKLCRLSVNNFYYKDAILLADLSKLVDKSAELKYLKPLSIVLDDIPAIDVDFNKASKLSEGQKVYVLDGNLNEKEVMDEVYITYKRNPIALAKYERGFILPKKIF